VTSREAEAAARLLERLLSDPAFRADFRRNPVAASRAAGLPTVAEEMAMSAGKAMETLDDRESRSSLAGVFMAAAFEGAGVYDFSKDLVPHLHGIPEQVEQVLSSVHHHGGLTTPAGLADVGIPAAGGSAPVEPLPPPNAAGEFAAITPEQAAGAGTAGDAEGDAAAPADPVASAVAATEDDSGGPDGSVSEEAGDDEDEDEDDASDGEQPDADDGPSGDGSTGGDGDHDDNSDGTPGSGGEGGDERVGEGSGQTGDGGRRSDDVKLDVGDDPGVGQLDLAGDVPNDTAPRADIAAWMASEAQKRGLPGELPVMAALTESDLHNLKYGDADSLGYFQMRAGTWNQGEYAGYSDKPELQLKWFLDQAEAVKRGRIAAGKPVDEAGGYGDWIADIERPKLEYRGRYQLHLDEARELLRGRGEDRVGGDAGLQVVPAVDERAGPRAAAALAEARKQLGTPYLWGGSSPSTGFDCSGLVQWAYAKAGIQIPRTSEQQILASNGKAVDREHLEPGDLVFFRDAGGDVHHVGISLGGDKFINAPHTGAKVRVDDLSEEYYAREFAGGRRFDLGGGGGEASVAAASPGPGAAIDSDAVKKAEAALARDAAEAQRPGTLLFEAVRAQELRKEFHTQVLGAVEPAPAA
jgi:NlpC/P60 family